MHIARPTSPPPPPGFTLVEILAVLAVVAIAAGLMIPAFARARSAAETAACKSNLHLWGQGFQAYAADHRGRFPHTDNETRSDHSPGVQAHQHSWVDEIPPYLDLPAWRDYPSGRKPTGSPWQCPAARFGPDSDYSYNRREGSFSYAMNSYLSYDFPYGGFTGGGPFLNTLKCVAPARTILLFDQASTPRGGLHPNIANRAAGRHPGEDVTALAVRHRKFLGAEGANFLFIDGHVDWRDDVWVRQHSDIPEEGDDYEWFPYDYSR
ncbi:MAG: prepilin-type N-terminal cleavage/methylation domain-containing protein [Kiritimatiellae bacterium]|nr:prepilin-type N-terminal cleavage/methylation domain-containing protein [Kiritimatiellia bacterium]